MTFLILQFIFPEFIKIKIVFHNKTDDIIFLFLSSNLYKICVACNFKIQMYTQDTGYDPYIHNYSLVLNILSL